MLSLAAPAPTKEAVTSSPSFFLFPLETLQIASTQRIFLSYTRLFHFSTGLSLEHVPGDPLLWPERHLGRQALRRRRWNADSRSKFTRWNHHFIRSDRRTSISTHNVSGRIAEVHTANEELKNTSLAL